jgi:hypothetical protein
MSARSTQLTRRLCGSSELFFEPFHLHLEAADLLVQARDQPILRALTPRRCEERCEAIEGFPLPLGHRARMTRELTGDLSRGLLLPQRFNRDLRLDCRVEPSSAVSFHRSSLLFEEENLPYPPV